MQIDADALLSKDPLALLLGMLLDQQFPMERAFAGPAFSALAPNLVPRDLLPRAIALTRFTNSTSAQSRASMKVLITIPARRQSATSRSVAPITVASSPIEFL